MSGGMPGLLAAAPGCERIREYEAFLNQVFTGTRASGMCQYNRKRVTTSPIDMALATHSTAVIAGRQVFNPFFQHGTAL
jgi:hypothetical protein